MVKQRVEFRSRISHVIEKKNIGSNTFSFNVVNITYCYYCCFFLMLANGSILDSILRFERLKNEIQREFILSRAIWFGYHSLPVGLHFFRDFYISVIITCTCIQRSCIVLYRIKKYPVFLRGEARGGKRPQPVESLNGECRNKPLTEKTHTKRFIRRMSIIALENSCSSWQFNVARARVILRARIKCVHVYYNAAVGN